MLAALLEQLGHDPATGDGWAALDWLCSPNAALGGWLALRRLRANQERVLAAARRRLAEDPDRPPAVTPLAQR